MTRGQAWTEGRACRLRLKGHAEGSPEICAAVSALVFALAGYLKNREAVRVHEMKLEPGDVDIRFYGGWDDRAAFDLVCIGLHQIAADERYTQYLRMEGGLQDA